MSYPTGVVWEPGRTIWTFPVARVSLSANFGHVVVAGRLIPLFWGDFWRTATNPSVDDIQQAIADILASPYLSELMQYGFQSLSLDPAALVIAPGPPFPTFSGDDVKNMVWDLIDDGRFPDPDDGGEGNVFMVVAPRGASYDDAGAGGAHGAADDTDYLVDTDSAWVGWVDYGDALVETDALDFITASLTHELVEILTDPAPGSGWTVDNQPDLHNEIGDICGGQTGVVSGRQVAAYYSERLKACVVPAFPHQFGVTLSVQSQPIGPPRLQNIGRTQTTKRSICFEGSYEWTLVGQQRRFTMTAGTAGYQNPAFDWSVNGVSVPSFGMPGPANQPITAPAGTALDPLALITDMPPATATADVSAGGAVLILESKLGQPPGDFDVSCTVTEGALPAGYQTSRIGEQTVTVTGSLRFMDDRFQQDLANCLHLQTVLARKLIEEVVIPRAPGGDPAAPWIERASSALESEAERQAHEARFLAHFVEAIDPELATTLRGLAAGWIAVSHAKDAGGLEGVQAQG